MLRIWWQFLGEVTTSNMCLFGFFGNAWKKARQDLDTSREELAGNWTQTSIFTRVWNDKSMIFHTINININIKKYIYIYHHFDLGSVSLPHPFPGFFPTHRHLPLPPPRCSTDNSIEADDGGFKCLVRMTWVLLRLGNAQLQVTLPSRGINISHLGKRKIISKSSFKTGYVSSFEKIWVKHGNLSQVGMNIKKYLKPPPSIYIIFSQYQ